ncbi:MAG: hypothetical protein FJ246_08365 [Nitrospira sp.]|nr:hypothetical protein [Nitrospira sp.]
MKMVMIVFRDSLKDEVLTLLQARGIKAYTLLSEVTGMGQSGMARGAFASLGFNSLLLAALPDDQADQAIGDLKAFHDGLAKEHPSGKAPVHAFVFPCTQVV